MILSVFNKVPHNEEVIYIPHVPDRIQLIRQSVLKLPGRFSVTLLQSLITKLLKIFPGSQSVRHIILRQLRDPELDLHMAPVCDPLSVIQRLEGIWEELLHLLRRFHIILTALISHPVFIRELLPCLYTEQNIMRFRIFRIRVMDIISRHQLDPRLLGHFQKLLVHQCLVRDAMILQLEEIISLAEDILIFQGSLFRFVIKPLHDIALHFSRQAGAQRDNPLMIFSQKRFVHARLVIVSLHKAF